MSDKQVEIERRRGDFFRDMLAELYGCPPYSLDSLCEHGSCQFVYDDVEADYAKCWDDVERRQR